jgi:YidC/Oxa1 family membrane protein insertase
MSALFDGIAAVLAFFYSIWPSYGGAIILLTLAVMVIMTPLTLKGTRSMMAMQRLQPEMKKIQERYKDDREKLNEELLAFYRENNINPVGGCLPLLLQMPVFIVLYRVVSGLTVPGSQVGVQSGWLAGQLGGGADPEALVGAPSEVSRQPFDPAYLNHESDLYQSLSGSFEMPFLGMNLAESASQAIGGGLVHLLPYLLMIALVAFSGWYQQRQIMARNNGEPNPQQQMIARLMLFFLPAISFGLPMGVVLYFVVSNLYRVGQQAYITRTMYSGDDAVGSSNGATASKAKAGGNGAGADAKNGKAKDGKGSKTGDKDSKARSGERPTKPPAKGKGGGRVTPSPKRASTSGTATKSSSGRRSGKGKKFTSDPRLKNPSLPNEATPRPRKKRK